MARKRKKKSKGRKKKRRTEAKAPSAEAGDGDAPVEEEREPTVIDLDDDLDDPAARAELVAAAVALSDSGSPDPEDDTQAGDGDGAHAADSVDDTDERDESDGPDASDDASGEAAADDSDPTPGDEEVAAADGPDAGAETADQGNGETPLIGPDALLALAQFRDEGVATVPEELILELGESTSPTERDRLLAAALAHVEMQEAIYRVPTESGTSRRWKALIAAGILVLALLVAVIPPDVLVPEAPASVSGADRLRGIRAALLMQAEQIEAFRVREERLPTSLDEVPTAIPGIRFVRSSNRIYQLIAYTPDGDAVVYDSAAPDPEFEDAGVTLETEAES